MDKTGATIPTAARMCLRSTTQKELSDVSVKVIRSEKKERQKPVQRGLCEDRGPGLWSWFASPFAGFILFPLDVVPDDRRTSSLPESRSFSQVLPAPSQFNTEVAR